MKNGSFYLYQSTIIYPFYHPKRIKTYLDRAMMQVHSGPMRFAELDAFVDGVLSGGPLEQKLQATGDWEVLGAEGLENVETSMIYILNNDVQP